MQLNLINENLTKEIMKYTLVAERGVSSRIGS